MWWDIFGRRAVSSVQDMPKDDSKYYLDDGQRLFWKTICEKAGEIKWGQRRAFPTAVFGSSRKENPFVEASCSEEGEERLHIVKLYHYSWCTLHGAVKTRNRCSKVYGSEKSNVCSTIGLSMHVYGRVLMVKWTKTRKAVLVLWKDEVWLWCPHSWQEVFNLYRYV